MDQLGTLLEVNQALTGAPNLRPALRRVLEILERHTEVAHASVTLQTQDDGRVVLETSHAGAGEPARTKQRPGDELTARTIESGKPIIVPQVSHEPLFARPGGDGDRRELSFISTIATFGTAQDIALERIAIESYVPEDAATADALHERPT